MFDQYQDWLHVYLPTRPNDATGWIKAADVTVSKPLEYQIKVSLADHKLTLLKNGAVQFEAPAATGTGDTPTPTGTFYYTDPLDLATQPGTGYGVFAIGLSGHSNVLQTFAGGDGQIAVHGTDDSGHHRPGRVARVRPGAERHRHPAGATPPAGDAGDDGADSRGQNPSGSAKGSPGCGSTSTVGSTPSAAARPS